MIVAFFAIGFGSTIALVSTSVIRYVANKPTEKELQELNLLNQKFEVHRKKLEEYSTFDGHRYVFEKYRGTCQV